MELQFSCKDVEVWREALGNYGALISRLEQEKPKMGGLDHFYSVELPSTLAERSPPFITREELASIVDWKLTRGKWRPRLLSFALAQDENVVKATSEKAFSALPNLEEAIACLSTLKGIGPATASAVLAAFSPRLAPFMSDEAMEAILGNVKEYTMKQYLLLAQKLQAKSKELGRGDEKTDLTASDLERALWCSAKQKQFLNGGKKKSSTTVLVDAPKEKKRKKVSR